MQFHQLSIVFPFKIGENQLFSWVVVLLLNSSIEKLMDF